MYRTVFQYIDLQHLCREWKLSWTALCRLRRYRWLEYPLVSNMSNFFVHNHVRKWSWQYHQYPARCPFNRLTSTQVVVLLFVVTINHDEQLCDRVLGLDWYLLSSAGHYIIWIPYNCVNSHCSDKYTTNEWCQLKFTRCKVRGYLLKLCVKYQSDDDLHKCKVYKLQGSMMLNSPALQPKQALPF